MFIKPERHERHAGRAGSASLQRRTAWREVELVAAARVLHRRRFYKSLIVGVIVVVALAQMARTVLVRVVRDLIAWDNARLADWEKQLPRQRMARAPGDAVLEGTVIPPRQPGDLSRQRNAVWLGVGLVAAARALRNRRFDEQVIVVIFAMAALAPMGWKELAGAVRDLIAWDNTRLTHWEKQLSRQREAEPADADAVAVGRLGPEPGTQALVDH